MSQEEPRIHEWEAPSGDPGATAEWLVPDVDQRRVCLAILADSISRVHERRPWCWKLDKISLNLKIGLTVGQRRVYLLDNDSLALAVDAHNLSTGATRNVETVKKGDSLIIPHSEVPNVWPLIESGYISTLFGAADYVRLGFPESIRYGGSFIHYLRSTLDRPLLEADFPRHSDRLLAARRQSAAEIAIQTARITGRVPWHILPPGEHPFPRILAYFQDLQSKHPGVRYDTDRLAKVFGLAPSDCYLGTDEFSGYAAFYFGDLDTAVMESPKWGNAIYVIRGAWREVSRLSKRELIVNHGPRTERITHSGDWLNRLKWTLERRRK